MLTQDLQPDTVVQLQITQVKIVLAFTENRSGTKKRKLQQPNRKLTAVHVQIRKARLRSSRGRKSNLLSIRKFSNLEVRLKMWFQHSSRDMPLSNTSRSRLNVAFWDKHCTVSHATPTPFKIAGKNVKCSDVHTIATT